MYYINKKPSKSNRQSSSNISFFKRHHKTIFFIIVLLILILIGIIIYVATKNNNHLPGPTSHKPKPIVPIPTYKPMKGKIKGTWSSLIGCDKDNFNLISLASSLPGDLNVNDMTDFFQNYIVGNFQKDLSNNNVRYIISVGGSNAPESDWNKFFNTLTNIDNAKKFYNSCRQNGMVGIDLDLEQTTKDMVPNIIQTLKNLKQIDNNFIIMLTILLGTPSSFAGLLNYPELYDYLSLMLYNGGIYEANTSGAGCDWDGWAELFLSKGVNGCLSPLKEDKQQYISDSNISKVEPQKILLGLIIDTTGKKIDTNIIIRANALIDKYNGAGIMLWVLPGWANKNSISDLNTLGIKVNAKNCQHTSGSCSKPDNECDGSCNCIATSCGKKSQGVTDELCNVCPGQTWWPCNKVGFCECKK